MPATEARPPRSPSAARRLRVSAGLIAVGLVIQGLSLPSATQVSFLTLAGGASLVAIGIAVYLAVIATG